MSIFSGDADAERRSVRGLHRHVAQRASARPGALDAASRRGCVAVGGGAETPPAGRRGAAAGVAGPRPAGMDQRRRRATRHTGAWLFRRQPAAAGRAGATVVCADASRGARRRTSPLARTSSCAMRLVPRADGPDGGTDVLRRQHQGRAGGATLATGAALQDDRIAQAWNSVRHDHVLDSCARARRSHGRRRHGVELTQNVLMSRPPATRSRGTSEASTAYREGRPVSTLRLMRSSAAGSTGRPPRCGGFGAAARWAARPGAARRGARRIGT